MVRKLYEQLGFSLVEVMVAMGVVGAGALTYMQLQKNNINANKRTEARYDVTNLARDINSMLTDQKACLNTFNSINFSGAVNSTGTITDIKDGTTAPGKVVYNIGTVVENSIEVTGYQYQITSALVDTGTGQRAGTFEVSFFYRNTNKALGNNNTYEKKTGQTYQVLTDMAGIIQSCYADTDNIISENVRRSCEAIGGSLNTTTMLCNLTEKDFATTEITDIESATQFEGISISQFNVSIIPNLLNPSFLFYDQANTVLGTITMSQPLILAQNPVANLDTVPKKYLDDRLTCPAGTVGIYNTNTGTVNCTDLLCNNSKTSAQQYMVGLDGNGNKVCNPLVEVDGSSCTTGALKVQPDGSVKYECCTPSCSGNSNYCTDEFFSSSNGCGLCQGTKTQQNASWSAWTNTGEYRDASACNGGLKQIERKQTRTCDNAQACGGLTCSGSSEQWVDAGTQTCTPPKSCTSSCDCDGQYDVCESNVCVDRSAPGSCINGTLAKGDASCQFQCNGGNWVCPTGGQSCTPKGMCTGYGYGTTSELFTFGAPDTGSCDSGYRYQYLDIVTSQFKRGNIYTITRGESVTAEVLPGDTPRMVLERLANTMNSTNIMASGACGSSPNRATVLSNTRIQVRFQWQHSTAPSATRSCNELNETQCGATDGCSWNTTRTHFCVGWNYTVPQGRCNGTYYKQACAYNGFGSGSESECRYGYYDQADCNSSEASSKGCYWGSVSETCYAANASACSALGGGCSWQAYPDTHRSCTAITDENSCNNTGGACSWVAK